MALVSGLARGVGLAAAALALTAPPAATGEVPAPGGRAANPGAVAGGIPSARGPRLAADMPDPGLRLSLGAEERQPERRRSFVVPAIEVPAFVFALNWGNRLAGHEWAVVNGFDNLWHHALHGPWVFDADDIATNFSDHPYGGSIYYAMARSSGLDFYWSFGFAFAGSLLWELGGETEPPSRNDQVMTSVGGTLLGEALYRAFVLVLNDGDAPGFWREASAFAVSPAAGFNRLLFGDAHRSPVWDERPAVFYLLSAGGGLARNHGPSGERLEGGHAIAAFQMEYGQPADPSFQVRRPLDAFSLRLSVGGGPAGAVTTTQVHGTIAGWRLDAGPFSGIWGMVGNYDFVDAGPYRVGSAALGLGAAGEFALSPSASLAASLSLLGVLMGAAGTTAQPEGGRDYHVGPGAQANLELRLYLGTAAVAELSAREFYVGSAAFPGWEDITYVTLGTWLRLGGHHGIAVVARGSRRGAHYPGAPDVKQDATALTLSYAWMSDRRLGAAPRAVAPE